MSRDWLYTARWYADDIMGRKTYAEAYASARELHEYCSRNLDINAADDQEPPETKSGKDPDSISAGFKYEMPTIVETDIRVTPRGQYQTPSKKAKGLVVHFTAGRWAKGKQDALGTLRWLGSSGLGCMVMDTDGIIYKAKNQDIMSEWDSHAGSSKWKGLSSLSRFCMGMEICNAGKLDSNRKAWFGQTVPEDETRTVSASENRKPGIYHKYTQAQEDALTNFCLWQLDVNPEFDIEWIVGHDEIAPTRKNDPGGSLSMTMPDFRDRIKELAK